MNPARPEGRNASVDAAPVGTVERLRQTLAPLIGEGIDLESDAASLRIGGRTVPVEGGVLRFRRDDGYNASFAMHALMVRHFMYGAYYPTGTAERIAETMLQTVADAGGWTAVRHSVEEIVVRRGRVEGVRLARGQEIPAKRVISGFLFFLGDDFLDFRFDIDIGITGGDGNVQPEDVIVGPDMIAQFVQLRIQVFSNAEYEYPEKNDKNR